MPTPQRLHRIIALKKGRGADAKKRGDAAYHLMQRHQLATGGYGTFDPATDQDLPQLPEAKHVQLVAEHVLAEYLDSQAPMWDITATLDAGNAVAKADVKVSERSGEGTRERTLLRGVPVTTLIFLEKELVHLRNVISAAPELAPGSWAPDPAHSGVLRSPDREVATTKAVKDQKVVIQPTDKHPGQWTDITTNVRSGTWYRYDVTGAMDADRKKLLLARVSELADAVKTAREEANATEVEDVRIADPVVSWLTAL